MRILYTGALAAALTIGAAAAQADELRLTENQLDTVTAGTFALPDGFLDGLPELSAGFLDGLLPELPDGLPDGLPELPGGLPDFFSNILSLVGDLPINGSPPS